MHLCKLCFHSAIWSSGHDDSQLAPLRVGSMIYHTALAYHNFEKNLGCHVWKRRCHDSAKGQQVLKKRQHEYIFTSLVLESNRSTQRTHQVTKQIVAYSYPSPSTRHK